MFRDEVNQIIILICKFMYNINAIHSFEIEYFH